MRIVCATCGEDLAADEYRCERCHPPSARPVRLSNLAEVVLTAAALDGKKSGPLDGEALRSAARARKELPS